MSLHPQAKSFLDCLKSRGAPPIHTLTPEENREGSRIMSKRTALPPEPVAAVQERFIPVENGKIKLRIYTPEGKGPFPVFIHFYGGGWVIGNMDAVDSPLRILTNSARCIVISAGYRLAPEHKFPTAVNDCYQAVKWAFENAPELNGDPGRIAIGGESAGGNLAAVVSLMARDRGSPPISYQVLIYPCTDFSREYPSYSKFNGYFLTLEDMQYFDDHYLRTEEDRKNIYASPILAEDLSNLPPALVITAGYDPLHDEGEAYARRLKKAGVEVTYYCYEDMIHGFFSYAGLMDKAKDLVARIAHSLQTSIGQAKQG
ncbi:MAG: alpha/beta hydrolase [Firmicutes bacterium]|nr:alpha/beta hydrolase [Bacillota bacterium]